MSVALLVPGPFDLVSGGYIYDRRMVEGLRALGQEVQVVELAGRHPLPDAAATDAARTALETLPEGTRIVIDGLGLPAFAPLAERLAARRAVALIHHPTALEHGAPQADRAALREMEAALLPRLARLVATSPLTAQRLAADFAVDPARIGVVEPGTDPAPRARGSGGPGVAILSVGALTPRKGHDLLLQALARLPDLDWRLTIVGAVRDRVHANGLRALAEELGIAQRVTFAGEVGQEALEALYAGADLFALATYWEGYGMAAAEAMARGLPVAITAGGAIADIVPIEAGVVSPPGDLVSYTKALRRCLFDHALRAEMAEAAWQTGQRLPRWSDGAAAFLAELQRA
ncbi:glycosyltransferase family 4 protein [Siccirubricoccus sp. KC 17139]|uniref:Glycosyltransferase family 4 protein n=1 Tax=Siccirubricoccus soli TaxID=2899147 RepID=A0ABT1D4T7_9PROT|nr:glycosyltransferase family 4 protein [Siccirubricoccus soli]MCO6416884.1 glycosyltransferase family 4 protein [Siccirubricoccus soli]MCP2683019.1 glycosyltransferase family 4 protein [Siccirubricoccus soli]